MGSSLVSNLAPAPRIFYDWFVMRNAIVWVDIPALNLNRALKFYSAVLGVDVRRVTMGDFALGLIPHEEVGVGGCIAEMEGTQPSVAGPLVYLNVDGRLEEATAAVEPNGGCVLAPKHQIGQYGFRSVVRDSEGNRIALHSPN